MPAYSITSVLGEFSHAHTRSRDLLTTARSLRRTDGGSIHVRDLEDVASLVLLKLTLAWESFLEETFLRYLCGADSSAGGFPVLIVPRERTISSAYKTLLAGARYLNWSPSSTIKRASLYFGSGEPYDAAVSGAISDLNDMISIRNRIAHRSAFSVAEFQAVVRDQFGYVATGMTPGRFLLSHLPKRNAIAFDHYGAVLAATAHLIAHHP